MTENLCQIPSGTVVLVTGATGFTGSNLVRKLCAAGLKVRAIARASSNLEPLKGLDIEWIRGDVYDPQVIAQAAKGVEYIFHLAAAYREANVPDERYGQVHVDSTKLLAQEALKNPNFKRFIHTSTIGVHGHIDNPPADENYRFSPGDLYQITKAEAELWFRDFASKNNLPFVIIRPAAIYGPGDKRLLKVFRMASKPFFPLLGYGKCLYHLIHVDDLTNAIILAATSPAALGETFIVGNAEAIPLTPMGPVIAKTLGSSCKVIRFPALPFFWLGALCEAICKPFGIEPPIYRRRVAFFTKDRAFNTAKLRNKLGFNYKYSNENGLTETTNWYVKNGWLKPKHQ